MAGAMATIATASDIKVDNKVLTRETVEKKDFDGYICNLSEGDRLEWTVTYVSGDDLNVHLMTGAEYDNLKQGRSSYYILNYSRDRTEFYEDGLNATGILLGRIVLVVLTQGEANSTSTYDIEVKVTVAKGPQNLLDMLCGLGVGICALLIIGAIVLVVMVYYIFKRFSCVMSDGTTKEDRPEAKGIDGMMRPGFNVAIGPAAEPAKPKPKKRKGKARPVHGKAVGQRISPSRTASAKPKGAIKCPGCGETVDAGEGFCPSCGSDLG
jgi:hypothetical protein